MIGHDDASVQANIGSCVVVRGGVHRSWRAHLLPSPRVAARLPESDETKYVILARAPSPVKLSFVLHPSDSLPYLHYSERCGDMGSRPLPD
jgi:hypothetical protein